jgi:hypothetical protein
LIIDIPAFDIVQPVRYSDGIFNEIIFNFSADRLEAGDNANPILVHDINLADGDKMISLTHRIPFEALRWTQRIEIKKRVNLPFPYQLREGEQQQPSIVVNVPEQPAPIVHVHVPERAQTVDHTDIIRDGQGQLKKLISYSTDADGPA